MRVAGWRAPQIFKQIEENAIEACNELMDDLVVAAKALCKPGTITREGKWKTATVSFTPATRNRRKIPVEKREQISFQAEQWTGREPGQLRDTIRRVNKPERPGNVRVYAGNKKVNYAHFVEYGTVKMKPKPFMRPAFQQMKKDLKARIEEKICMLPDVVK
jgi:HK97 gp10 family phage protein